MSRLRVEAVGENTSLAERKLRAGQRMLIGFEGTGLDETTRSLIRELRPAGFILFARNVEEPSQVLELNRELASLLPASHPPILSVDQEGGRVQRVKDGASLFPPLRFVGNIDDPELTRRYARALATEVLACGFNLNWAPVADVDSNPDNPIIGDRSFHRDPDRVALHVAAYVEATQEAGLIACAKHFPGHGDTATDSHLTLPTVEREQPELERCELTPFRAAAQAGVGTMMTAHVMFPAFDQDHPATMSPPILDGILRRRLGYQGVIVSDDLEMKGVRDFFPLRHQLDQSCLATADLFLVCSEPAFQVQCFEELVRLQERDKRHDDLAEDSNRRLLKLRERFFLGDSPTPAAQLLDCAEHRDLLHFVRARGGE